MTSDEIKKVREAATLLLRWHVGGIESDESHPWNGMDYDDLNYEKAEAIEVVCGFARSLVGTDVEQPITVDWLREEWGFEKHGTGCYQVENFRLWFGVMSKFYCHGEGPVELNINGNIHRIAYRYQFRLLAAALGIAKKGE